MSKPIERPPIGSRWKENDPRVERIVTVLGYEERTGQVCITSKPGVISWANPKRFNGKRGGYSRVN